TSQRGPHLAFGHLPSNAWEKKLLHKHRSLALDAVGPDVGFADLHARQIEDVVERRIDGGRHGADGRGERGLDLGGRGERESQYLHAEIALAEKRRGERTGEILGRDG